MQEERDTTDRGRAARAAWDERARAHGDSQRYLGFFAGRAVGLAGGVVLSAALVITGGV